MLQNGLKLDANGMNVVASVFGLFKNVLDGLGLGRTGRVLNFEPVQNFLRPVIRRGGNVPKRDGRTANGIALLQTELPFYE